MQTTEELKREMYRALAILKGRIVINYSINDMLRGADEFESALEDHHSALRIELHEMTRLRHAYERVACDYTKKSVDLEKRLIAMTANRDELARSNLSGDGAYAEMKQERDDLRNRLQAFEFANKAAGEELRSANEVIKRQREYISEIWGVSKAIESRDGTSAQDSTGNASETICGPFYGQCQHSFRTQYAFPNGELQKQCVFCMLTVED